MRLRQPKTIEERLVGRRPAQAFELAGREPVDLLVSGRARSRWRLHVANQIQVEHEQALRSDGQGSADQVVHRDLQGQFFPKLASKGLVGVFTSFDLAAGKLPESSSRTPRQATADQIAALAPEGASHDENRTRVVREGFRR